MSEEKQMKWRVHGTVTGGMYLGEVTCTRSQLPSNLDDLDYPSFCHQCADSCESAEITGYYAEPQDAGDEPAWEMVDGEVRGDECDLFPDNPEPVPPGPYRAALETLTQTRPRRYHA